MASKYSMDMTKGPLFSMMIKFTVPIILTNLLQLLYNAADLIVVGQFSGTRNAVGAVGATGSLVGLLTNLFIGLGIGVNVVVGHAIGADKKDDVKVIIGTAAIIAIVSGVLLAVVGLFFSRSLLLLMSTPDELLTLSAKYLTIFLLGAPANLLFNFFVAVLRAYGDTKRPLLFLVVSGFVNIILNIVFVAAFKMDVNGVAIATVISQYLSAAMVFITLLKSKDYCRFEWKSFKINCYYLKKILLVGLPTGAYSCLFSASNVIIQSASNSFNSAVITNGIAASSNLENFIWMSMNAVAVTTTSFVSQNYGAKKFDRIKSVLLRAIALVFAVWSIFAIIFFLFKKQLFNLYLPGDEMSIKYGITRGMMLIVPYFIGGFMDSVTGALRGLNRSLLTMIISVIGTCGFRIVWVFGFFYRIKATSSEFAALSFLYLSYPISWTIVLSVLILCFVAVIKKEKKKYNNQESLLTVQ